MLDFIPLYELAVGPKAAWPVNQEGEKVGVNVVRKGSGLHVMTVTIDALSIRGHIDALKIARYFCTQHNALLAKHRREQARARSTRSQLIMEKHNVRTS